MIILEQHLTDRQIRFLRVMYPDGTVSVGLTVGEVLHRAGYLRIMRNHRGDRYALTDTGKAAAQAVRTARQGRRRRSRAQREASGEASA